MPDADWYVDPLGRFDGRFYDGERWTERVSDNGALALDPDFASQTEFAAHEFADSPAVAPVQVARHRQASLIEESPVRTVAVLDKLVAPGQHGAQDHAITERQGRAPVVWALLALIAALLVAALVLLTSNDTPSEAIAESVELDQEQEARVEDLETGGIAEDDAAAPAEELEVDAPAGAVAPGTRFGPGEEIEVGGLRILNGESALTSLREWHREFAAARGVELGPSSSCWFGQLGGAAVQVAHCGPVGGTSDTEFLFDSVPLVFEEAPVGGQIAQPVVDAATIDMVLANALVLVGRAGDAPPGS